jgi:hypothetical protein
MIGVFGGGVRPPVEFGIENSEIKGMVAGASAEPSSSSLHPISSDKACPMGIELCKYFREVIGVRFVGLVVRVPPS